MRGDCVMGLDCGTQSAKAAVWTVEGAPVAQGSSPLTVSSPRPGWAEQDPREWWSSACLAARAACAGMDARRVGALGVAWQRESFAFVDAAGSPVRPAILWLDIRSHAEAAALAAEGDSLHAETGMLPDVTLALPRIAWLRRHEPALLAGRPRWVDVGCWLLERLTGRRASCVAGADTAGMISLASRDWSERILARAGLRRGDVPELVEPSEVVGKLSSAAASETGLPAGIPVVAAGGDGQVFAALLLGGEDGGCSLTLGTSIVLGIPSSGCPISPFFRTLVAAVPERSHLLEAVVQSGAYLFRWLEESFFRGGGGGPEGREQEAASLPPGAEGLVTVPHWWGTRFPVARPQARGVTLGWGDHHGAAHFHRSLLEGVAFELRHYLDGMTASAPGPAIRWVTVGGGGARSALWLGIIRDVLGLGLRVSPPEPVALGAAMLALLGSGGVSDLRMARAHLVPDAAPVAPDQGRSERYDEIRREVYLPLRQQGMEISARLSSLGRR